MLKRIGVEEFKRRYGRLFETEKQVVYIRKIGSESPKYIPKIELS
jgi:hypothetical protein